MANNSMETTKGDAGCGWVKARLPLWVGDRASPTNPIEEGGELTVLECRKIERHLDQCVACGRYRSDLEGALGVLAAVAVESPVEPDAPSLWPLLRRRIESSHRVPAAHGRRTAGGFWGVWVRILSDFTADLPLRRAWAHDYLRAMFAIPERRLGLGFFFEIGLRSSLAASLVVAAIAVSGIRREWALAERTIETNASPLLEQESPVSESVIQQRPEPGGFDGPEAQAELAQAEITRAVDVSGSGGSSTSEPRPAPPARYGYDLEHGIPMPPDARESKPVY
jgi:hypothetical protein